MDYLTRPVFSFVYDWSNQITRQANYDLRTQQIGFGGMVGEPQQQYTANAYSLAVDLPDGCAVNAMERFVQGVFGRMRGFWLPTPERACEITAGVSGSQFLIAKQGLLETYLNDPAVHLCFIDPDHADVPAQFAAISSVEAVDAATERVTLSTALTTPVTERWDVHRLLYVRLTEDDLSLSFYDDNAATCKLSVLELPVEYASVELGDRPAFGYHFWRTASGVAEHWYFTSFDQAIDIGTELTLSLYTPAPISHGNVESSLSGDREELEIDTWRFEGNPLNAWMPFAPQYDLMVEVWEVDLASGNPNIGTRLFAGLVETVQPTGKSLRVTCSTRLDRLNTKLPRPRIQKTCNNVLYGPCCRASREAHSFSTTITGIDATGISVTLSAAGIGDKASGRFAFGDALSHDAAGLPEYRAIVSSTTGGAGSDQHSIQLSSPFSRKLEIGDTLVVAEGCDLSKETCQAEFNNYDNFFGHPFIQDNLSLKAIKLAQGGQGKGGGK